MQANTRKLKALKDRFLPRGTTARAFQCHIFALGIASNIASVPLSLMLFSTGLMLESLSFCTAVTLKAVVIKPEVIEMKNVRRAERREPKS